MHGTTGGGASAGGGGGVAGVGASAQALTRYQVLFDAVRAKRRRPADLSGLDRVAARVGVNVRSARVTLAWLRRQAEEVDRLGQAMKSHSDGALAAVLAELREVFVRGRQDDDTVRRGLSAVREAARRETGETAYVVQIMGALALYHGRIVQMLTGEGKTLTGSIATPLLAWRHKHLHVFTVNDYLAKRDAESRAGIYARCGLTCGSIQQEQEPAERSRLYALPIVYGTPKQITADYLRDHIGLGQTGSAWAARGAAAHRTGAVAMGGAGGPLVPGLRAAMVDEADAVLIDEGVVPLIIARSRGQDAMAEVYRDAARAAALLEPTVHFRVELLHKRVDLTRAGRVRVAEITETFLDPIWRAQRRAEELIRQALVARTCYHHGRQYQIVDGRIMIVDEYTGRFLHDRHWEHGLHQAVEAKEGIEITADRETLARMSFQRFFRSYPVLCGMTGTAADATAEIESVYQHKVTVIPTNRPVIRVEWASRVFRTPEGRWNAVAESIERLHRAERPVLVGTRSIAASELLSAKLTARGLPHQVLNANFDKEEASIISRAGEHGSIVVATNMAGRGTDIKLDLKARAAGGLHVILTEMHGAKRIDRQFIGRAGRQGDPGSAQFFMSLDDELLRLHARGATAALLRITTSDELSGPALTLARRVFRWAQRASEARDRRMRVSVMKSDTWAEKHLPGA
ncbi:MAG: hypothetical protein AB7K52_14165 [Phycisphaerales bacterium]